MNQAVDAITAILGALGGLGGLGALVRWRVERRATRAKAALDEAGATKALTDIAVGLLTPLRTQVDELVKDLAHSRAEVVTLRDDVRGLHEWINLLIAALEAAGQPVPPRPSVLPPVATPITPSPRGGSSLRSEPPQ